MYLMYIGILDYLARNIENYKANTTKHTFARMIVSVHATDCFFNHLEDGNAKNTVFGVKRYAVRNVKIRPYAVCKLKIKQFTRVGRLSSSLVLISDNKRNYVVGG